MGLPQLNIIFQTKAATLIQRSQKGIVALILKDDSAGLTKDSYVYTSIDQLDTGWTAENKQLLTFCFMGTPKKIYVEKVETSGDSTLANCLQRLGNRRWNYLAFPSGSDADMTTIMTWIKTKRNTDKKTYKFVGGGIVADDMGIINFDSDNVLVDNVKYSKIKWTSRLVGLFAGLPIDRSSTYQAFSEVEGFDELADDDARNSAINAGKLILINDGEKIKIARGVNSMTTTTATQGAVFKKIRIVDTVDMIRDDLTDTIRDNYIGKWINTYDNKQLLIAAINSYFRTLQREGTLDPNSTNLCKIDIDAQEIYLNGLGVDTKDMTELEIAKYNTNDQVFLMANIKPTDAMEDFAIAIYL